MDKIKATINSWDEDYDIIQAYECGCFDYKYKGKSKCYNWQSCGNTHSCDNHNISSQILDIIEKYNSEIAALEKMRESEITELEIKNNKEREKRVIITLDTHVHQNDL